MNTKQLVGGLLILLVALLSAQIATSQEITDPSKIESVKRFCFANSFYFTKFKLYQRDSVFLLIPTKADSTCKSYIQQPVIIDVNLTKVIYGYPCPRSSQISVLQEYNKIPWYERLTPDFDEYIYFNYETNEGFRDFDYVYADAGLGGGYQLPRCESPECLQKYARQAYGVGTADSCFALERVDNLNFPTNPFLIYHFTKPVQLFNVNFIPGDDLIFYGFGYFFISTNAQAGKNYSLTASKGLLGAITVDSSRAAISFSSLANKVQFSGNNIIEANIIGFDINSKSIFRVDDNTNQYTYFGFPIPPHSRLQTTRSKIISVYPASDIKINNYPTFLKNNSIYFKNNHPSSYVFRDTLIEGKIQTYSGGIVINTLKDDGSILGYHIKSNRPITIDNIEFAPRQWISLDSTQKIGSGFLNTNQTVLGVPLLSYDNVVSQNNLTPSSWEVPHAFKIINNKVVSGYLSTNFDYLTPEGVLPLSSPGQFKLTPRGDLEVGGFYKAFNYKTHTYYPGEKILYSYKIDKTLTILNEEELKAVVYYFQGHLQEITKKELAKAARHSGLTGDYGESDITQNTTYELSSNGFTLKNLVHVRNFLWQAWPLSDCDADISYQLSLKWNRDYRLNAYRFYLPSVWANNVGWRTSFCPIGPGLFAPIASIWFSIFSPFIQLNPDVDVYYLNARIDEKLRDFRQQIDNLPLANLELLNLYIENKQLKADFQYNVYTH